MMRIALVILILLSLAGLSSAALGGQPIKLSDTPNGVTLLEQNQTGLTLRVTLGSLDAIPVATAEGNFTLLTASGMARSQRIGEPNVPLANRLLSIPVGSDLSVEVLSSLSEEVSLTNLGITDPLIPVQPSLSKSQNPEDVPFEFKHEIYQRGGYYQLPAATTEIIGIMRGVRVGLISVAPVQYNPTENKIKIYTEITVRVSFDHPDWIGTEKMYQQTYSPAFEPIYQQLYNYNTGVFGVRNDLVKYPIKYVIVADRTFQSQLAPFIAWKVKEGFKVITAYTDSIGSSTSAIKSFLQTLYSAGSPDDPAPSFALFVGDTPQIPAWAGSAGSHITDLRYCEFTGDNLPEMYYGRFSAQNPTQLQPQIDKTLEYEEYTMPDPSYLGHVTLIAGVDAGYAPTYGNGQINYGTNLYFNASHGVTSNTWLYPASDAAGASAAIIQTVNQGIGLINYTAHGSHDGWADPSFTVSDINGLTNIHKYGLSIGNCCLTNTFDEGTPCYGEAWMQAANKGGIGYIGGTNNTYWDEDYWWGVGGGKAIIAAGPPYDASHLGAYDGVFHDHDEPVSEHYVTNFAINMAGLLAVQQSGSSRATYYWEVYTLMGDPSVMTYLRVPLTNDVSHQASVLMTATSFDVSADPGSYVGISVAGVLHGAAYVDASGSVTVPLTPFAQPATADIVITAQNRVPYISTIQVIAPSGPYVIYNSHSINDAAGNNNGIVDFGESIILGVQLINVGPDAANNVVATLSTTDTYIAITDNNEAYGTIPGNMGIANIANAFAFNVDPSTPDGHRVKFDLTVTGTQRDTLWSSSFNVTAHAPAVAYLSVSVNDAGGNNNGIFDPGETVSFAVTLKNSGSGTAYNVTATLSELDDHVTVSDPNGTFGTIASGGGTASNLSDVFAASADSTCPMGHSLLCKLTIVGDGGYLTASNFNLTIGDRAVFFLEDFTIEQGWTGLNGPAEWQIGAAVGGSGGSGNADPSDDHTPGPDNFILGNDLTASGTYNNGIAATDWITSPIIDCDAATGVIMTYYHQLGVESPSYDHAYLEAYDGNQWVQLYANAASVNESGWTESVYALDSIADNNPLFQIRFGLGPTDGSVQYGGWNIDDIQFKGYVSGTAGTAALQYTPGSLIDSTIEGTTIPHTIKVKNVGQANLRVRFVPANAWVECSSQLNFIAPGDSLNFSVNIKTTGLAAGSHSSAVNYTSNDANHTSGSIPVDVFIYAPQAVIATDSINCRVPSLGEASKPLIINNTGAGKLNYLISCQVDDKSGLPEVPTVVEPLGFRAADPEKLDVEDPYFPEQTKNTGGPDAFGYTWKDSDEPGGPTFGWIDIEATGTDITSGLADDNFIGPFPIGFAFPFYDSACSQFWVGSNGLIGFGPTTDYSAFSNSTLPIAATPNHIIAWCWDDLNINDPDSPGGKVLYQLVGGNLVIEFARYPEYDGTVNPGDVISAEIILSPDGDIILQYQTIAPGFDILSCTVGIENVNGTSGLTVVYNAAYLHDGLAVAFENPMYRWLSADPLGGSVAPHSMDTITVAFDAVECIDSTYTGRMVIATNDPQMPTKTISVVMRVGKVYTTGDVNTDQLVNISDAVYIIAFIFSGGPAPNPMEAGDVECNGMVNISDAVYLINYIFSGGPAPCFK